MFISNNTERIALITPSGRKASARSALAEVLMSHGWTRADAVEDKAPEVQAPEVEAEEAPAPRRRRKADAADEE